MKFSLKRNHWKSFFGYVNTMRTVADVASNSDAAGQAFCGATTWPPMSSNRAAGIVWSERLMAQVRVCSGDTERFAGGMAAE